MPKNMTEQRLEETIAELKEEIEELKTELRQWDSWRSSYEENNDLDFWDYQVATVCRDMNELENYLKELRGAQEQLR